MTAILTDTFTGAAGAVSAHTADTGQNWSGTNSIIQLDGLGRVFINYSSPFGALMFSNAVVPQVATVLEVVIDIDTIPPNTYARNNSAEFSFWGHRDYIVTVYNKHASYGDGPALFISAVDGAGTVSAGIAVTSGSSHTVKWVIAPGEPTQLFIDGALVATTTNNPSTDVGSTEFQVYLVNNAAGGAPALLSFARVSSVAVGDGPPPPAAEFWTAFTGSHEVP